MLVGLSLLPEDFLQWILPMVDQINKLKKVLQRFAHHGKFTIHLARLTITPEISNFLITNQLSMETLQLHRTINIGRPMTIEFHLVLMHLKWVANKLHCQNNNSHMVNLIAHKLQLRQSLTITSEKTLVTPYKVDTLILSNSKSLTHPSVTILKSDTPTLRRRLRSSSKLKTNSHGQVLNRILNWKDSKRSMPK